MAIYMRITVNGKRADMSAGRECEPNKWSRAGRAIGTKEEIKSINNYLDSLQTKLKTAQRVLVDSNSESRSKVCIISSQEKLIRAVI
jgi:hypothetical protein